MLSEVVGLGKYRLYEVVSSYVRLMNNSGVGLKLLFRQVRQGRQVRQDRQVL